jgi:hypothetical protein
VAYYLEFDHIAMKRKNVMTMAWEGYAQDTIQIEMNKCEIRCANCHRRKTAADGKHFPPQSSSRCRASAVTTAPGYAPDRAPVAQLARASGF